MSRWSIWRHHFGMVCWNPVCVGGIWSARLAQSNRPKSKSPQYPGSYTCVWAQVELDKSTWQVALVKFTCHPRLWLLFKSLDKWQLVKATCQVNLQGDPPKITFASCPKNPLRGVLGGVSGHSHGQKKCQSDLIFYFFDQTFFGENYVLELFWSVLHHKRPHCNLAVLLRRWWIFRNNL